MEFLGKALNECIADYREFVNNDCPQVPRDGNVKPKTGYLLFTRSQNVTMNRKKTGGRTRKSHFLTIRFSTAGSNVGTPFSWTDDETEASASIFDGPSYIEAETGSWAFSMAEVGG